MAMRCPIVSTRIGVEGLPVEAGRHYLAADAAEDFAGAVVQLLENGNEASRIAAEARAYVEANASSRFAARAFEQVCMRAAGLAAG
jgi:glycosyltransferase involved in cell wall biosynthesis